MSRSMNDLELIASKHGWQLNPNAKIVEMLLKKANKNKTDFGGYYCPCKLKRSDDNICPCKDAQSEITKDGHCHCNLFLKIK